MGNKQNSINTSFTKKHRKRKPNHGCFGAAARAAIARNDSEQQPTQPNQHFENVVSKTEEEPGQDLSVVKLEIEDPEPGPSLNITTDDAGQYTVVISANWMQQQNSIPSLPIDPLSTESQEHMQLTYYNEHKPAFSAEDDILVQAAKEAQTVQAEARKPGIPATEPTPSVANDQTLLVEIDSEPVRTKRKYVKRKFAAPTESRNTREQDQEKKKLKKIIGEAKSVNVEGIHKKIDEVSKKQDKILYALLTQIDKDDQFDKYAKYTASILREMPKKRAAAMMKQIMELLIQESQIEYQDM